MDSPAAYEPWSRIEDIDVPVVGLHDADGTPISRIRVPYVYGKDAVAVTGTATIVAIAVLKALKLAKLITEGVSDPGAANQPWMPDSVRAVMEKHWDSLVRFRCPSCEDSWDTWPGDDGKIQDVSEVLCSNSSCSRFRQMGEPQG